MRSVTSFSYSPRTFLSLGNGGCKSNACDDNEGFEADHHGIRLKMYSFSTFYLIFEQSTEKSDESTCDGTVPLMTWHIPRDR
jgi:hypothetical protein